MKTGYKPYRLRIYRRVTKNRILTVEDALQFDKVALTLVDYEAGKGQKAAVEHYVDRQTMALLCHDLLHYRPKSTPWWNGYQEYKGSQKGETITARTLKVELTDAKNPIKITAWNGPGEAVGNGAIKPAKGRTQEGDQVAVLLDWTAARTMALAVLHHIQAWTTMTYLTRLKDDTFSPPDAPPPMPDDQTGEIPI